MGIEDYAVNLLLVALVVRQIRGKKLTAFGLLWPVGLVVAVGAKYLAGVPTSAADVLMLVVCGVLGAGLGLGCAGLTRIHRRDDGTLLGRASGTAALLWVAGTGARLVFALYAENGGGPVIARFGAAHDIAASAWAAALVTMALTEVVGRSGLLAVRRARLERVTALPSAG